MPITRHKNGPMLAKYSFDRKLYFADLPIANPIPKFGRIKPYMFVANGTYDGKRPFIESKVGQF